MNDQRLSGLDSAARPQGMRTMKNQVGDWVALKGQTQDTPGKVIAATSDSVTVRFRFDGGERELTFDHPLPRIRWRRQNGRARWSYA